MTIPQRLRPASAWVLALYFAQLFLRAGWGKFGTDPFWTAAFAAWGYPAWFRVFIGVTEILGALALLLPSLASYGGLALVLVMMGAWSTLAHDLRWRDMAVVALYGAGLAWISMVWWSRRLRAGRRQPILRQLRH
jgi:putative oxidoreductase